MTDKTPEVHEALAVYASETVETDRVSPGYKPSEVDVIPEDWEVTTLGNVATLQRGYDLPQRVRRRGTIPIVSSSGIYDTHNQSQVRGPGVVTGRYGTIGEVFFIKDDFWPLNTTLFVKDFKGNDPLFISYLLRTVDFHSHSGKSGVPGVNRNDLHQLAVRLPSTSEQRAIAAALSDVDDLISALDKLIAKKRAVKTAAMQQLLTGKQRLPGFSGEWSRVELGELGSFAKGKGIRRNELVSDGLPCVRYGEIYTLHHDHIRTLHSFIPRSVAQMSQCIRRGDLLFTGSGETMEEIGKCVAYLGDQEAYAGGDIVILSPESDNSMFLGYLMNHSSIVTQKSSLGQGDAVVHISARNLASLEFDLPPIEEQTAIAAVLSDMDAEIEALEGRREKTRRFKQGMMQELLTGRTRLHHAGSLA